MACQAYFDINKFLRASKGLYSLSRLRTNALTRSSVTLPYPRAIASKSLIADRRSPSDSFARYLRALSSHSIFSLLHMYERTLATTVSVSLLKAISLEASLSGFSFVSQGSLAVITTGCIVISISSSIAFNPPLSAVPEIPSTSSNNMIFLREPKRLICVAASLATLSISSLRRKSLAFISISSKPYSCAAASTILVLPHPGGP